MRETSGTKTHMEGSAPFLDVGYEDARAGRLVAALDDHDAQALHPLVNITMEHHRHHHHVFVGNHQLALVHPQLPLGSELFELVRLKDLQNFFIRNDVGDENVIGDDDGYVDDDNVIDDDGEDLDNW